jgi:hypothetical protein
MATTNNSKQRNQKEFKHNRLKVLDNGNAVCHWCGVNQATEADHLEPTDNGGTNAIDNLVPACKPCNARRGQQYAQQKQRAKTLTPQGFGEPVFLQTQAKPPQALIPIFFGNQPEPALTGRYQPRLETTTHVGSQSRATEIGEFAERVLGLPLMPWQLHCLEGLTAFDDVGKWLHRVGLISVARQNGKSLLSSAVIGHWLTKEAEHRGQPQTVISVSHKLDLTAAQFSYLAPIMEAKFGAEVSWSYGRQKLTMPNGSVWHIRAATPAAGHGYSADLITADEVWQISEAAIDDGLLPSQRARKNPLCLLVSTAGTQESTALLRWRDQGLRAIDSGKQTTLYFAEFSPSPQLDPMTPEAWEYANPALAGGLIDLDVIEGEALGPNRSAFLRASVNLWQAVTTGWLETGVFDACKTDTPPPPGGVLAIESSTDEARYTAVRAVQAGNKTHVTVAFTANSVAEMWRLVDLEIENNPGLRLAIIPALEVSCPPALERRRTIVGYRELLKWTAAVRSMIIENRLQHNGELLLTQHVERAVLIKHNGSVALSSTRSPGPIEAARCMVWAAAMASRPQLVGKPMIMGANR